MRGDYDPLTALQNAGKLMRIELKPDGPMRLSGPYYLDGSMHAWRKDKLKVFVSRGEVWVYEEGGRGISLPQWLVEYGGAANWKDAVKMIKGERQSIVWSREMRNAAVPEVRYVEPAAVVGAAAYPLENCRLFRWMCGLFPADRVEDVWRRYNVTTDNRGNAVYWYTDQKGRVLYDKRIAYKEDGHRDKDFFPARQYRVKDGYTGRCYFGAHTLEDGKKVYVCESEKTALLVKLYYDRQCVATGGKSNLRGLEPNMVLLPDMDARKEWEEHGEVWPWWERWGLPLADIPASADIGDMIEWKIKNGKI